MLSSMTLGSRDQTLALVVPNALKTQCKLSKHGALLRQTWHLSHHHSFVIQWLPEFVVRYFFLALSYLFLR